MDLIFINACHSVGHSTCARNEGTENPLIRAATLLAVQKVAVETPNMS